MNVWMDLFLVQKRTFFPTDVFPFAIYKIGKKRERDLFVQLDSEWELNEWKINLMLEIFIEPDAVKISQNKEFNVDLSINLCSMDGHSYGFDLHL